VSRGSALTVRISPELQSQLDRVAEVIGRPKSWIVQQALEAFVAAQAWQIDEIKRGLAEADAGDFAGEAEVEEAFRKWRAEGRDTD
jgi:RHH-type rel operon transcriptional repressor/antitoxin RelB